MANLEVAISVDEPSMLRPSLPAFRTPIVPEILECYPVRRMLPAVETGASVEVIQAQNKIHRVPNYSKDKKLLKRHMLSDPLELLRNSGEIIVLTPRGFRRFEFREWGEGTLNRG